MTRLTKLALVAMLAVVASAHVGSPNVFFDGKAGPYDVRVIIRPPMVVPGRAEVIVRLPGGDASRVVARPVFWRTGTAGAPEGDVLARVAGAPSTYSGQLWLMSRGGYGIYVTVAGMRGSGTAIVPVNSFATGRLGMSAGLGALLVVLGGILFTGLITIVRAAAADSLVPAGDVIDSRRTRRANLITALSLPVIAVLIFGGAKWWESVDRDYQRTMFRPPAAMASFRDAGGHRELEIMLRDTGAFRALYTPIVPDHGKMVHLFVIGGPASASFAHLHPVAAESTTFRAAFPPLPPGDYRVFADVVTESGASLTATTRMDVRTSSGAIVPSDSDDAWTVGRTAIPIRSGATDTLAAGLTMTWTGESAALRAGQETDLRFAVNDPAGRIAELQPYLGMAAHAVIMRDDGAVFIHLHPMGTVAPVLQRVFTLRDRGDTTKVGRIRLDGADASPAMPAPRMTGELSFPYEFPKPGRYEIWVQVKHAGRVLTGTFAADVH